MIGIQRGLAHQRSLRENDPETKDLSKTKIYNRLDDLYLLPPILSKGVNRAWLVEVWNDRVFRVSLRDWKQFEAGLSNKPYKKNSHTNLLHMVGRLNALLRAKGHHELGFPAFVVPDEKWLDKIARFVDRANLLEYFKDTIEPIQGITQRTPEPELIHFTRNIAYQNLLVRSGLISQPDVFTAVSEISESNQKKATRVLLLQEMNEKQQEATRENEIAESNVRDKVVKAATLIYQRENPQFRPEFLLNGAQNLAEQDQRRLGQLCDE